MVKITNTLTGIKEQFIPLAEKSIKLYVCGVTPYDRSHIGHGRCYVSFDTIYRILTFLGYSVTYCRNFTDIDDKLINKAQAQLGEPLLYKQIADEYIRLFHQEVDALGCLRPSYEPKVTESIDLIIAFIEGLIKKGFAYESEGDVYFDLTKVHNYPQLSKHKKEDLIAGARVQVGEKKRHPLDFALWKGEEEGTFFKSPWGYGRPGWHIECSAMASHYLGNHIDIHGGGEDLMFPHHDNEIVQSEALHGAPFARYWIHNGLLRVNKEKMSKSLGNIFALEDVFAQVDPMVLRYYYLMHHYRSPLDFSLEDLQSAGKSYKRLIELFKNVSTEFISASLVKNNPLIQSFIAYLEDDFNTAAVIGKIFENISKITEKNDGMAAVKWFMQNVLGLTLAVIKEKTIAITPEIQLLIDQRAQARKDKDFKKADELRDALQKLGFEVKDLRL